MALFPHERSLVKKYAEQPFALVGVNSDTDKKRFSERLEKYDVTWRSLWNGPKGPFGPISKKWDVPTWPWNVVLDARGVVRYQNVHGEALDDAVATLMLELDREKRPK